MLKSSNFLNKLHYFLCAFQMCQESLDVHSNRIAELREMIASIASEVGVDSSELLQGEVDALGKRLENVRESISTLADIAEARAVNEQECNNNINQTKAYLNSMQLVCVNDNKIMNEN